VENNRRYGRVRKKFILPVALSKAMLAVSIPVSSVFAQPADTKVVSSVQASKVWNEKASVPLFVKERFAEKYSSSTSTEALNYLKKNEGKTGINNPDKNLSSLMIVIGKWARILWHRLPKLTV
jgi:hypothetical protein